LFGKGFVGDVSVKVFDGSIVGKFITEGAHVD